MNQSRTVVWIDHQRAHVIKFDLEKSESVELHAHGGAAHLHHKHGAVGSGHAPVNHQYYEAVSQALKGSPGILVTGPASAKNELVKHIQEHDRVLAKAIAGVESLDHPTVGEILAHARQWFDAAGHMRGGKVSKPS